MSLRIDSSAIPKMPEVQPTRPEVATQGKNGSDGRAGQGVQKNGNSEAKITREEVSTAIDSLNQALDYIDKGLEFNVHEDTNRLMVRVIDKNTDKVIREIPPENILDMVARIKEMIGVLIDKRG